MENSTRVQGKVVNILHRKIEYAQVRIEKGRIAEITPQSVPTDTDPEEGPFILPGFIDAHVHVESSMLTPCQFARLAVVHGTVATVSDPHEIGNVLGVAGVKYMLDNGKQTPFKFCFGVPSCVPATVFETAGATITPEDIDQLFAQHPEMGYLAEMMNFPGVLHQDPDVWRKIAVAQRYGKPVDGHAPGLRGEAARQYSAAGISTDHECFTREEALDKLKFGMKILIREGSAAKNFEALVDLIRDYSDRMMFCSDDKHPDSLVEGHINQLVKRALEKERRLDLFDVLQVACVNPVLHYQLPVGLLRPGDPADFIVVDNLRNWNVLQTYLNGELVAEQGKTLIPNLPSGIVNQFDTNLKTPDQFQLRVNGSANHQRVRVIEALDSQLITHAREAVLPVIDGCVMPDASQDILKLVVVNRYRNAPPAMAFIQNVGLKEGAIASTVAHDSHNLIAVGVNDEAITRAINRLIREKGGISAISDQEEVVLPLPVAGLMSDADGYAVARQYSQLDAMAKAMGSTLQAPFMTLSFMALLVIPSLKLSDQGLFDGERFVFTDTLLENASS